MLYHTTVTETILSLTDSCNRRCNFLNLRLALKTKQNKNIKMVTFYLGCMILILVDVPVINLIYTHSYAFTFLLKLVFSQKNKAKIIQ